MYNDDVANAPTGVTHAARTFERVVVVRELAGRAVPVAIVHAFGPAGAELCVDERYTVTTALDAAGLDRLEADARIATTLRHPNLAAVRDVWREADVLHVTSEVVEGETLEEIRKLGTANKELSIEVGVRVVVDVLAALSALHALGSGGLAHGEVTANNVIVGFDGASRLVRPFRGRVAGKAGDVDWYSYAAPELSRGATADVRADLFAAGVLLWETLSRRKLFPKATREGRAARSVPIGKPVPPSDATWAVPLAVVAERALAYEPGARYSTAAEMAAAVRLAVRSKLAMPPRVAALVDKLAGARIVERRTQNALPETSRSIRPSLRPSLPDEAMRALSAMRPSSRPPTPKPGAVAAMPVVPKAPALPSATAPAPTPAPTLATPRTGPRPFAPPLRIATPPPPKPELEEAIEEAPISLDAAFVEMAPPMAPATAVVPVAPLVTAPVAPPPAQPIEPIALGVPPPRSGRALAIGAAVLLLVLDAVAMTLVLMTRSGDGPKPSTSATHANPTYTSTSTATATGTTMPTNATTATPTATALTPPPAVSDTASAAPSADDSATPLPTAEPSHRHTRPRPTYDPMGI